MGYTTDFTGSFKLNKKLSESDYRFLMEFNDTRHNGESEFKDTPGIWCGWIPSEDRESIEWDGGEKFYSYIPWIKWLMVNYLGPRGYTLDGEVEWQGEDSRDIGKIIINDGEVSYKTGTLTYEDVPALMKENEELRNTVAELMLTGETDKEVTWGEVVNTQLKEISGTGLISSNGGKNEESN